MSAVREILSEVGGLRVPAETLQPDDDLFAAGLTSFATVGVMLALEERFDVSFPDSLLKRSTFANVRALEDAVVSLGGTLDA